MKIPQKIYVALRYDKDLVRGFMAVADKEETKYCQKAKDRANYNAGRNCKSMYITNTANEGFRVIDYTNDGMLVEHPDGFSFFITPRNMFDLIRTCTITNGQIDNKLYFDENLTLISEVSEILSDNLLNEEKLKKRAELLKSLKFNDEFSYNGKTQIMVGRRHILTPSSYYSTEICSNSKLYYVFMEKETGIFNAEVKPLPSLSKEIKNNSHFTKTEDEVFEEVQKYFKSVDKNGYVKFPYFGISKKPIKKSQLKYKFTPCELSEIVVSNNCQRISVIKHSDDKFGYFGGFRNYVSTGYSWSSGYNSSTYSTIDCNKEKYYVQKEMIKVDNIFMTKNSFYSINEEDMKRFTCPVQELSLEVGYLEYYL